MKTPVPKTPPNQSRTSSSDSSEALFVRASRHYKQGTIDLAGRQEADTKPIMKSLAEPPRASRVAPSKASDILD